MVVQMVSTAVTGYTFLVHVQLYSIFPVLVIVPTLFICIVIHFFMQAQRKQRQEELQLLLAKSKPVAVIDEAEEVRKPKHVRHEAKPGSDSSSFLQSISEMSSSSDDESESDISIADSIDEMIHEPLGALLKYATSVHADDEDSSSMSGPSWLSSNEPSSDEDEDNNAIDVAVHLPTTSLGRRNAFLHGVDMLRKAHHAYYHDQQQQVMRIHEEDDGMSSIHLTVDGNHVVEEREEEEGHEWVAVEDVPQSYLGSSLDGLSALLPDEYSEHMDDVFPEGKEEEEQEAHERWFNNMIALDGLPDADDNHSSIGEASSESNASSESSLHDN
jgi:hypothetical protein